MHISMFIDTIVPQIALRDKDVMMQSVTFPPAGPPRFPVPSPQPGTIVTSTPSGQSVPDPDGFARVLTGSRTAPKPSTMDVAWELSALSTSSVPTGSFFDPVHARAAATALSAGAKPAAAILMGRDGKLTVHHLLQGRGTSFQGGPEQSHAVWAALHLDSDTLAHFPASLGSAWAGTQFGRHAGGELYELVDGAVRIAPLRDREQRDRFLGWTLQTHDEVGFE